MATTKEKTPHKQATTKASLMMYVKNFFILCLYISNIRLTQILCYSSFHCKINLFSFTKVPMCEWILPELNLFIFKETYPKKFEDCPV